MTNINKEEVNNKLKGVIEGIKLIPTLLKRFNEDLEKSFKSEGYDFIENVIKNEVDYNKVSEKQYLKLLEIVHSITKEETLNPENVKLEDSTSLHNVSSDEGSMYYNFEVKKQFAETYKTEETVRVTMAMFKKSAEIEKELNKDLYDFNIMELEMFFKSLNATTIRSIQTYISRVERYTEYALQNNLKEGDINFASVFDKSNRVQGFLDKEALDNLVFSKEEIMEMAIRADNAQDGVIIALLFDGVSLKNNYEELINLKIDKFDEVNETITTEEGRVIPLSKETAILVKHASDQGDRYVSTTGENHRTYKVAQGENVLRGLRGRDTVSVGVIGQRIYRTTENYGYHYMNATNISYNGRIHLVKKLMEEGNSVDKAVEITLDRFNVPKNKSSMFYLKRKVAEL